MDYTGCRPVFHEANSSPKLTVGASISVPGRGGGGRGAPDSHLLQVKVVPGFGLEVRKFLPRQQVKLCLCEKGNPKTSAIQTL